MKPNPFLGSIFLLLAGALTASAQFVVTSIADSGPGTLRQAIADAKADPAANTITFDEGLSGQTIELATSLSIVHDSSITVDATALPAGVTLKPSGAAVVFLLPYSYADPGSTGGFNHLILRGVTLAGGPATNVEAVTVWYTNSLTLSKCVFTGFKSGVINSGGTLVIDGCSFSNNRGPAVSYSENDRSGLLVSNSKFNGNSSPGGGGAMVFGYVAGPRNRQAPKIERCTFTGNSADTGGAVYVQGLALRIEHCTFIGNSARNGGAVYSSGDYFTGGGVILSQCTISGNSAVEGGGGITLEVPGSTLSNSIVYGNAAPVGGDIWYYVSPGRFTATAIIAKSVHNASPAPSTPFPFINADPLLAPLADNGGPTQTMAIRGGSPARNGSVDSTATHDQRGYSVVGRPDIGAYECLAGSFSSYSAWAATASANALDYDTDSDSDGAINGFEYALRRDPTESDVAAAPRMALSGVGRQFAFRYRAAARDLRYMVDRSFNIANPAAWTEVYRLDTSTGGVIESGVSGDENPATEVITITDSVSGPAQFYRLRSERIP